MLRNRSISLIGFLTVLLVLCLCSNTIAIEGYDAQKGYQYVSFGRYPQTADGGVEPILWRVLAVTDDYVYLLSEYVLFNHRVHEDYKEYEQFKGEFKRTEIFEILNGVFINEAFDTFEITYIVQDDALGRVFLVSADDLANKSYGFKNNKARQAFGTPYAIANGLFVYRNTPEARKTSPYWTRTRSEKLLSGVRCTKAAGNVGYIRCVVMNEGIRPAVRLSRSVVLEGTGMIGEPYHVIIEERKQEIE